MILKKYCSDILPYHLGYVTHDTILRPGTDRPPHSHTPTHQMPFQVIYTAVCLDRSAPWDRVLYKGWSAGVGGEKGKSAQNLPSSGGVEPLGYQTQRGRRGLGEGETAEGLCKHATTFSRSQPQTDHAFYSAHWARKLAYIDIPVCFQNKLGFMASAGMNLTCSLQKKNVPETANYPSWFWVKTINVLLTTRAPFRVRFSHGRRKRTAKPHYTRDMRGQPR